MHYNVHLCRVLPLRAAASLIVTCALLFVADSRVLAVPATDVASSFDEDDPFDINVRIGYEREMQNGSISREIAGVSATTIPLVKELTFSHVQQRLPIRTEIGLAPDFMVYVELPLILADDRTLKFDQNDDQGCGSPAETNCVTPLNSTLVRDGLLDGSSMSANQVTIGGSPAQNGSLFLPRRKGIDQLRLGMAWGVLSNHRDETKPSWVLGFEARLGLGDVMKYNAAQPGANDKIGQGLHQYHFYTSISKRYKYVDPWFSVYYMLPLATSSSLIDKTTFPKSGQERSGPQQRGGGELGFEIIPYESPANQYKVALEVSGHLDGYFEGRGYSPMWEIFANNAQLAGPCVADNVTGGAQSEFPGAWNNGTYCNQTTDSLPYPGVTSIENYAIYGLRVALNADLTKFMRGRIGFGYSGQSSHFITFGDAGQSSASDGRIRMYNEHDLNPVYRPLIDAPGRRFRVENERTWDFFVGAEGRF